LDKIKKRNREKGLRKRRNIGFHGSSQKKGNEKTYFETHRRQRAQDERDKERLMLSR